MNYLVYIAAIFFLSACSDKEPKPSLQDQEVPRLILPDAQIEQDAYILDTQEIDEGLPPNPNQEYQDTCWRRQAYYCTPDGGLPSPGDASLYQQEMVIDICDENGVPCTPLGPTDPNCSWTIVYQGECEDWLECNPEDPLVHENIPCQIIDENTEETTNGLQSFYCQKGTIVPGPCEPCSEEICDGLDNDCNGIADDLPIRECESECGTGELVCIEGQDICLGQDPQEEICDFQDNDCDGEIDEGQLNACNQCGLPPEDICDGLDNDCNGTIDLDKFGNQLVDVCETICGIGQQTCINGQWFCDAQIPEVEVCDGIDNDCDGDVDEEIDCQCPVELIGALVPCQNPPLLCGQGFMTCECANEDCTETQYSECLAPCHYLDPQNCDPNLGMTIPETCNNWDDDCNTLVDDGIPSRSCYSGPEGTVGVGICIAGTQTCENGNWGYRPEEQDFIPNICGEEQIPLEEELCNNLDDNCDGLEIDEMEPTDVLFIIDISGSMDQEIIAVANALKAFALYFSDEEVIQWALILGPKDAPNVEQLVLTHQFSGFDAFINNNFIVNPEVESSSLEMLLDALYLSIRDFSPIQPNVNWQPTVNSIPEINNFTLNWREDSNKVIIIFTDEESQSYLEPQTEAQSIIDIASNMNDISIYGFTPDSNFVKNSWIDVIIGGSWYELTSDQFIMYNNLMEILNESACGGL